MDWLASTLIQNFVQKFTPESPHIIPLALMQHNLFERAAAERKSNTELQEELEQLEATQQQLNFSRAIIEQEQARRASGAAGNRTASGDGSFFRKLSCHEGEESEGIAAEGAEEQGQEADPAQLAQGLKLARFV